MKTIKLDASAGSRFENVALKAKDLAAEKECLVSFEFNGTECIVNSATNLENLYRDYANSHLMEWKSVGADCVDEYSEEVKNDLENRRRVSDEKYAAQREEYRRKEAEEKALFENAVLGIEIDFKDEDGWNKSREANTDGYGSCCLDYAEGWAKLMQIEIDKGKSVAECAEKTSNQLGFYGITGAMYGFAVSILSQCWKHGEELRKWHNKN